MGTVAEYFSRFIEDYGTAGLSVAALFLISFIYATCIIWGKYSKIYKYRNSDRGEGTEIKGISVVVILRDDWYYLENILPRLLTQAYENFEVVIVELGTSEDFSEALNLIKDNDRRLISTRMEYDKRFPINDKMAYNVGIKAARYECIVLTTDRSYPASEKWLSCMAKGFTNGDVVLSYAGISMDKGIRNKFIRCDRLNTAVRFLSSAIKGRPYRGMIENLGFRSKLYFEKRGFNHLNMNIGEDDLFVQSIANKWNTSIVLNPHSKINVMPVASNGWWWTYRKFRGRAFRLYPLSVRLSVSTELMNRILFYGTAITGMVIFPLGMKVAIAALVLLRLFFMHYVYLKIRYRLHEPKLSLSLMLFDVIEPFYQAALNISARIKSPQGVYR